MSINPEIPSKPWKSSRPPKRILAVRLQAMGDTVITLPYLQGLKNSLPGDVQIDFLTRKEVAPIPEGIRLFNRVHKIGGKRNFYKQCFFAACMIPKLLLRRYDVVIDLQNNLISNKIRKILNPKAWSEFDKYSANAAGERTKRTIEAIGLGPCNMDGNYTFRPSTFNVDDFLSRCGWDGKSELIILNPAGAFESRHWPLENYVRFARLWLNDFPDTQFIVMGTKFIEEQAACFQRELKNKLLYMVGNNTPLEGFKIIQRIKLMLSEDSGLMHMSWVSDRPTVALFGSTRSDWVSPQNKKSMVFSSDDLACGSCMLEKCKYGDTHCLTRYTPEFIFEKIKNFMSEN